MIIGVGTDVVDIARFESQVRRVPALLSKIFNDFERIRAGKPLPMESLAARFAAKEAFAKALGAPPGLEWHDAWVETGPLNNPILRYQGTILAHVEGLGVTGAHVSLTHDAGIAQAFVVAEG